MVTLILRNWAGPEAQHCVPEPMAWSPGGDKSLSVESPGTLSSACHSPRTEQVGWAAATDVDSWWPGIDASLFYPTAVCHLMSFSIIRWSWHSDARMES